MFVSFRVCFALEERVQTTWIQNCKSKISKKTWIITSQNLYLFLLEKCYLSLILPFSENVRNKFQCYYFSVGCILNKLIVFSISQGPLLISDYQAKKENISFMILSLAFSCKVTSKTVTGSIPGFSFKPKEKLIYGSPSTPSPPPSSRRSSEKPVLRILVTWTACERTQHHLLSHQPWERHSSG